MQIRTVLLLLISALIITACGGGDDNKDDTQVDGEDIINIPEAVTLEGAILTWVGNGSSPAQVNASNPGELVTFSGNGERRSALSLPATTNRVNACGERATSINGRYFAFYVGNDDGKLYLMDNSALHEVDDVGALTCLGMGTFLYADDSSRFGYIDYTASAHTDNAPSGELVIRATSNRSEQGRYENAVAFDLTADALAFVGLFNDDEEAGIQIATDGAPAEITTLRASDNCRFRTGQVQFADADTLVVLLGDSCNSGASGNWHLYTVDINDRGSTEVASGRAGGGYFGNVRTNALFVSSDGSIAYITVPSGVSRERSDILAVSLDGSSQETLVDNAIMPHLGQLYLANTNSYPVISQDGRWFAAASNSPTNNADLNVIDVNSSDPVAVQFDAGNTGDTVSAMAFSQDGSQLVYVTGGNDSDDNSLFMMDMTAQVEERLVRGRYATQMIVSPDGTSVALGDWQNITQPRSDSFMNLMRVNLTDNTNSIIATGADVTETRVANKRFFYPLRWR